MDKYNFDFKKFNLDNTLKNEHKFNGETIDIAYQFGIAKTKVQLEEKSLECLDETYLKEVGIFVPMDYYSLTFSEDNVFTFGIGSCCGLVIFNGNYKFLMHISPKNGTDNILALLEELSILYDGEVYLFPGNACEYEKDGNKLDYIQLANKLESCNNNVYVKKFNSISGSIYLLNGKLIIIDDKPIEIKIFEVSTGLKK